ncbi:MAG: L,D-transpeptidase [Bacillota bacterium]
MKYTATDGTSSITLPAPAGHNVPAEQKKGKPMAKRKGDTLWLTHNGSIYSIHIGPPPAPSGVYPDPGSAGDKVIVDKNKNLLYLYKDGDLARVYRVATGEKPEYTPEGKFTVINKFAISPEPGKERFGPRWLGIGVPSHKDLRSEKPDQRAPKGIKYGIHGTDEPESIGTYASAGCIRLSNTDIMELYDLVEVNTPVEIIR